MEDLLTVSDVMRALRVSRATLYRQIKAGVIVPVKIGTITRFRASDLERLLLAQPSP